jgi:hypothetical protein|tara:strand:- start:162 stop:440 length:279 start_codon:yes stop_codon:yes gene_type:complete
MTSLSKEYKTPACSGIREIVERANSSSGTYIDMVYANINISERARTWGVSRGTARRGILIAYKREKETERRCIAHHKARIGAKIRARMGEDG